MTIVAIRFSDSAVTYAFECPRCGSAGRIGPTPRDPNEPLPEELREPVLSPTGDGQGGMPEPDEPDILGSGAGDKVVFTHPHRGMPVDQRQVRQFLKEGETYTLKSLHVGAFHTYVLLHEVPGQSFNAVHFTPDSGPRGRGLSMDEVEFGPGNSYRVGIEDGKLVVADRPGRNAPKVALGVRMVAWLYHNGIAGLMDAMGGP
jgi:hypothetical protein